MRISKIPVYASLGLAVLAVATVQAKDSRIDAAEQLLMTHWDTYPDDVVVEIVVDPVIGQSERYQVLRFFLEKQKTVARHREHVLRNYLPRLERMFREMPAEDARCCRLILQAIASLRQERDQSTAGTLEFLRQQIGEAARPEWKRAICRSLLAQMQGQSAAPTSADWQATDRKIAELLAKGAAGEAYRAALSVLSDTKQPAADRIAALECLDQMLASPTGVSFEQGRKDLTAVCEAAPGPALGKALVGSIMRVAFLEELDGEYAVDILKGLAQDRNPDVRDAAEAALAQLQTERQAWGFDLQAHLDQADRLVQQANLDASARQEYRELVDDPNYYAHPVGESPRWWVLGKFLWRQKATKASIEAFRQYLRTRERTAHVDDSLREAVKILATGREIIGQEPLEYWTDLARQPREGGVHAFVSALVEALSQPDDKQVLVRFGVAVLRQGDRPDLADAVLQRIVLSTQDAGPLEAAGTSETGRRYCRVAIAAALAREGKAAKAAEYIDLKMADPLPAVPLFRAVGVADALFAAGKAEEAETLVRVLLRRPGAGAQRPNLLVYLMTQQLKAGRTAQAIEVQDELSQGYGLDSPETVVEALGKCILAVRDKNPEAEIASTRLMCEVINGDNYHGWREQGPASKDAVIFWRAVLEWSQDNEETTGLEEFARRDPSSSEADLARVLLANGALDRGRRGPAAEWLRGVRESSAVSALAGEQRRRLMAFEDRNRVLQEELGAIRLRCRDADVGAQCQSLLAEMDGATPPVPTSRAGASQVREGAAGEAYADAMNRLGVALRTAGRYQQAAACFHNGFAGAPYAKAAADLLKEEAYTLRFYLAAMEESEVRLKQLVAIYPHHPAAQWARTYLSTQANLQHPE